LIGGGQLLKGGSRRVKLPEEIADSPEPNIGKINKRAVSAVTIIPNGNPPPNIALTLIGTKTQSKIDAILKMLESEYQINPLYERESKKEFPAAGRRFELKPNEVKEIGTSLNPQLRKDFMDYYWVT
jgi:hypothetical protein